MSEIPRYVLVVAPQGSGKTRHAAALAERFGCTSIVDEWDGRAAVPDGALVLTNVPMDELARGGHVPAAGLREAG